MDVRGKRINTASLVLFLCCIAALCLAQEKGTARKDGTKQTPDWAEELVSKEQLDAAAKYGVPVAFENSIGMRFVLIPPGAFMMGSNEYDSEKPVHRVRITKPFYMGVTEVTQGQYEAVMGKNPAHFKGEGNPVECVSWNDAVEFCKKLTKRTGKTVRLPTEAEWEYACRAGSTGEYCFGDDESRLGDYAWFFLNSGKRQLPAGTEWEVGKVLGEWGCQTHPVARKKPNAWGLYDMHGNVWEWCADWYDDYPTGDVSNPIGASTGSHRVVRGGSWSLPAGNARSATRSGYSPAYGGNRGVGFRVVFARDF